MKAIIYKNFNEINFKYNLCIYMLMGIGDWGLGIGGLGLGIGGRGLGGGGWG